MKLFHIMCRTELWRVKWHHCKYLVYKTSVLTHVLKNFVPFCFWSHLLWHYAASPNKKTQRKEIVKRVSVEIPHLNLERRRSRFAKNQLSVSVSSMISFYSHFSVGATGAGRRCREEAKAEKHNGRRAQNPPACTWSLLFSTSKSVSWALEIQGWLEVSVLPVTVLF